MVTNICVVATYHTFYCCLVLSGVRCRPLIINMCILTKTEHVVIYQSVYIHVKIAYIFIYADTSGVCAFLRTEKMKQSILTLHTFGTLCAYVH